MASCVCVGNWLHRIRLCAVSTAAVLRYFQKQRCYRCVRRKQLGTQDTNITPVRQVTCGLRGLLSCCTIREHITGHLNGKTYFVVFRLLSHAPYNVNRAPQSGCRARSAVSILNLLSYLVRQTRLQTRSTRTLLQIGID